MDNSLKFERFFLITCFICSSFLYAPKANCQQKKLPVEVSSQIDNYKVNAIKNRNIGNDNIAASYLNKIAFLYWEYYLYQEAVNYFQQVLTINQDQENTSGVQKVMENLAFVYSDMERYDKAIEYFEQSYTMVKQKGEKPKIAESLSNLALAYSNNGLYDKAILKAEEGLELSKNLNNLKLMRSFYGILHESHDKKGNKEKAVEYFGLYSTIDKHIQQELFRQKELASQQRLSEAEAQKEEAIHEKEETQVELVKTQDTLKQSQLEIDLLNAENEAKEAKIKAKEARLKAERRLRHSIIIVFVFVCIMTFLIYRQMKLKKRANAKLQELYKEIEKKNKQILDSINYASHIQEAILPFEKAMQKNLPESFVFYKPRDIVSGDFYWFSEHENRTFIAAIDCTGHGVPGAFMSMIGNTLLNEIINEKEILDPAEVLKLLNKKVIFTLNQDNDEQGFSEDGMDITLCCYDKTKNSIEIALANHSAVIFQGGTQHIIEGDLFSIGGNIEPISDIEFQNHTIKLDKPTTLYMYSDGFQDQFGGQKKQKYMASRFLKLLHSLQNKEFMEHGKLLEDEFLHWKGDEKQIDDILVIGIKF